MGKVRVITTDLPERARRDIEELYDREAQAIFRTINAIVLNRTTAQDLTRETFVRAMWAWERLDWQNPREWLLEIASNLAVSHHRTERRRRAVPPGADGGDLVSRLMRPLTPDQRALVVLHHYHHVSRTEIGEMLGIPVTVASRIDKAMLAMRRRAASIRDSVPAESGGGSEFERLREARP